MSRRAATSIDPLHGRWAYRYEVAHPARHGVPRLVVNRYGWKVIGIAVVVGRYAYCLKWAAA